MSSDFDDGVHNAALGYGGTGGTGMSAGHIGTPTLTLVKGRSATPTELYNRVRNNRIQQMAGFTGGVGQTGIEISPHGELISDVSEDDENRLVNLTLEKIDSLGLEELERVIISNNDAIDAAVAELDAENGHRAYMSGKALLRAQYVISSRNSLKDGFEKWCDEHLTTKRMKSRTRKKHMDIARIPDALDYAVFGIEKLAALAPILKQIEDIDPLHPVKDFLEKYEVELKNCADATELRFEVGLGMAMSKLKTNKIQVGKEFVRKFMECGFEVTKKDIDAMKTASDTGGDPAKYLDRVIKNKKRPSVLTTDANKPPRNFQEQAQEIRDTVATLLKSPSVSKDIQIDRIDALIQDLEALKHRLSGTSPADTTAETAASAPPVPPQIPSTPDVAAASNE